MKKIFTLIAGAALLFALTMGTANAQASGPFADVPTDHWAYQSVDTLQKAGIVIGYPDGTYGGKRAMTRYEFAVAIARLLKLIPAPQPAVDLSGYATKQDLTDLQNSLLQKLADNQAALDALKALVEQFTPELQELGQDVTAVKARLDALEGRVTALEIEQRRVHITGELNSIVESDINLYKNSKPFETKDGYIVGAFNNHGTPSVNDRSAFRDAQVYNDVLLDIVGRVSDDSQLVIKLDAGNYLPNIGSATSYAARYADKEGNNNLPGTVNQVTIYQAYYDTAVGLGPLGAGHAEFGQLPVQFTPFTLKAINPDSYATTPETQSTPGWGGPGGDVEVGGAKVSASAGPIKYTVFGGQNPEIGGEPFGIVAGPSVQGVEADGTPIGAHRPGSLVDAAGQSFGGAVISNNQVNDIAGARATFGDPGTGQVGVTAVLLGLQDVTTEPYHNLQYNNLEVYGADFHGLVPFVSDRFGLTLDSEVAISETGEYDRFGNVNSNKGNEAWIAELGYKLGTFGFKGGYEQIYSSFAAPGYWAHVGTWTNPTNVEGPIIDSNIDITDDLSLISKAYFYKGIDNAGAISPLGKRDDLSGIQTDLKYDISSTYDVDLGYEWDQYIINNQQTLLRTPSGAAAPSGKPTEQYVTLGLTHAFNSNASLKLLYQVIDYKDKGTYFDPLGNNGGAVALSQLSVKF